MKTLQLPVNVSQELKDSLPQTHSDGFASVLTLISEDKGYKLCVDHRNTLISAVSNECLYLLSKTDQYSVLVLLVPQQATPHDRFVYASMLQTVSHALQVTRTKTITSIDKLSLGSLDQDSQAALSENEKEHLSILKAIEAEREEQIKMHSDNKTTEAARSGGFHEISFQWQPEVQALVKGLFESFRDGQFVDQDGQPLYVKYIQFNEQIQHQVAKHASGVVAELDQRTLIRTAKISKELLEMFPEDDLPRFMVLAYPVGDQVRKVMVHQLPAGAQVKMVYNMLTVSFRRQLRTIGVEWDSMSFEYNGQATFGELIKDIETEL